MEIKHCPHCGHNLSRIATLCAPGDPILFVCGACNNHWINDRVKNSIQLIIGGDAGPQ